MRFQSYFNTAVQLILAYDGAVPLAGYLKQYFAQHKKHGSKDRKYISHLCYCYYRLGHALKQLTAEERLKAALYLCTDDIGEWNILFDEAWMKNHTSLTRKRLAFVQTVYPFSITDIFQWGHALSDGIDVEAFALSHLVQPDLFLRIRPGKNNIVINKLQQQNISFKQLAENVISLPNSSKIDSVIALNKEAVVQDLSSQQIAQFFSPVQPGSKQPVTVWDCCAASGGKSILAYDSFKNIDLTVSDIRASIIHNLQQRFNDAGINHYKSFVTDLSLTPSALHLQPFDLILCDAPCSGSGTWGRTPEQLYFFTEDKISHYSALQQKIVHTVIPHIKKGGYLLYITCSVFRQENEMMVNVIQQQYDLQLVDTKLITGYFAKADTMFGALFKA